MPHVVTQSCVGDGSCFMDEEQKDTLSDLSARVRRAFRYAERPTRFVFGTDWPLIPVAAYRQYVATLVPPQWHAEVFSENAANLFRL